MITYSILTVISPFPNDIEGFIQNYHIHSVASTETQY